MLWSVSKFWDFETRVLDLGLNGRGVGVYGLLWGFITAAQWTSYGIGLPLRVLWVFSIYNWLWAEDLVGTEYFYV